MATKRPAFPSIRLWIIANNLNQRVHRLPKPFPADATVESAFARSSWRYASRRMSRYLLQRLESASFPKIAVPSIPDPDEVPSLWKPYLSMLIRSLRRQTKDCDSRWQRRIFQILESDFHLTKPQASYRQRAWQVCFQILKSHNYWKRPRSPTSAVDQTWQHTLWRAAHLKKRPSAELIIPAAWTICFRIILADSFRSRTRAWDKTITNLAQNHLSLRRS